MTIMTIMTNALNSGVTVWWSFDWNDWLYFKHWNIA